MDRGQAMKYWLEISLSGKDTLAIAKALLALPPFCDSLPSELSIDHRNKMVDCGWIESLRRGEEFEALWGEEESQLFTIHKPDFVVLASIPDCEDPRAWVGRIAQLPFELATLSSPHTDQWKSERVWRSGFADMHYSHGWTSMFKGAGHNRLVSRRWLEHGPWRTSRIEAGDVTRLEFHDLDASYEVATEQAALGHERLGISDLGGFLQTDYVYAHSFDGIYDETQRLLKIPVAARELTAREMLDACAVRHYRRTDDDQPIERVAFVFPIPGEAEPYLHELWLRGLECWTIADGKEARLDEDYAPDPEKPAWV